MYQAIGIKTKSVYAQGTRADCFRLLNHKYPYVSSSRGGKWGRGNIVTVKPVFDEAIRIVRIKKDLLPQ